MGGTDSKPEMDEPSDRLPPARTRTRSAEPVLAPGPTRARASSDEGYEVGYRKPPAAHRFQPGRSGNPKGRPKGSLSISAIITDELNKPIAARVGGRTVTMSRRQALVRRFMEQALNGDLRAFALLLKLDGASAGGPDGATAVVEQPLTSEEQVMLQGFLRSVAEEAEGGSQ
jgi:Family of unknown function (DUF5681)